MSLAAATPAFDPPAEASAAADEAEVLAAAVVRAERRLRLLAELSEIGMNLARRLDRRSEAAEAAEEALPLEGSPTQSAKPAPEDFAASFAKLSRSVRLTLDLEARADEALRALRAGEVVALAARRVAREHAASEAAEKRAEEMRDKVQLQAGIAIMAESENEAEESERLDALEQRLDDDCAYEDLDGRNLRQIVQQLCGDLELSPDWSTWTDDGWPEPPAGGPGARSTDSPFHQASRRRIDSPFKAHAANRVQLPGP